MDGSVTRDARIASLAAKQFGHITRQQLFDLGLTANQIDKRIAKGLLIPVFTGVYAVGHPRPEGIARAAAAVLACGPDAVLSDFSAAALWGLARWPTLHEVTVPRRRRPTGIRVHLRPTVQSKDIRKHRAIRVTTPARTLLDIAPRQTEAGRARSVNEALLSKQMRLDHLSDVLRRYRKHQGSSLLSPFVNEHAGPTRSEFERRFVAFTKRYGLPKPKMNTFVAGFEVDALFEAERVIVELDSWEFHRDRASFERDRNRDAATLLADHITVRITWDRLTQDAESEAARLHSILESRR